MKLIRKGVVLIFWADSLTSISAPIFSYIPRYPILVRITQLDGDLSTPKVDGPSILRPGVYGTVGKKY